MPIGKNAIKRVINNGYSNVKTSAPDMENSVIEEAKKPAAKKTPAKNPVPKGVTSTGKVPSSSRKNRAPRAAILPEGVIPKKSAAKPAVKPVGEAVEVKEEKAAEVKELLTETSVETVEAVAEVKEEVKSEETVTAEEIKTEEVKAEAPLKSMESEPELNPVRTFEKVTEKNERTGDGYVNFGADLPYYLL